MCGIIYAEDYTGNPVNNMILQVFDNQRSRGTEGFGIFDGQEMNMVHAKKENKILNWLVKYDSNQILFHHRNPTSTINVAKAAHPFSTKDYFGDTQYVLIHNGHILNSSWLKTEHEELGVKYHSVLDDNTFNDSESLLWDLALTLEGRQKSLEAYGGIAFICLKLEKGKITKLMFARNSNPLNMYREKNGILLSSEGDGDPIERDMLYTYHYKSKRLTKKKLTVPAYYSDRDSYEYTPVETRSVETYDNGYRYSTPYATPYDDDWDEYVEGDVLTESVASGLLTEHDLKRLCPSTKAIEMVTMGFLFRASGVFEKAYEQAEDEYVELLDLGLLSEQEKRRVVMLEWVMSEITYHPENENRSSVCSEVKELAWV